MQNPSPELAQWIEARKADIAAHRNNLQRPQSQIKQYWKSLSMCDEQNYAEECDELLGKKSRACKEGRVMSHTSGPLMRTSWGQGCKYNDFCPPFIGNEEGNCDHAPTGCVATAMAQIMKYHRYPRGYNWDAMADAKGTPETSRLIYDIGKSIDTEYGATESAASMKRVSQALAYFRYRFTGERHSYNDDRVIKELMYHRPVLFSGSRKNPKGEHAWVCDGYKTTYFPCDQMGFLYLHMNWGWNNIGNGWYGFDNFTVEGRTYNRNLEIITNIAP